jgi:hypothetical protein
MSAGGGLPGLLSLLVETTAAKCLEQLSLLENCFYPKVSVLAQEVCMPSP